MVAGTLTGSEAAGCAGREENRRSLTASATLSVTASPWERTALTILVLTASTRERTKGCSMTRTALAFMRSYRARPARVPRT